MDLRLRDQIASRSTSGYGLHYDGVKLIIVNGLFIILATIAVILRFVARRMKRAPFFVEDYLLLIALVCSFYCTSGITD